MDNPEIEPHKCSQVFSIKVQKQPVGKGQVFAANRSGTLFIWLSKAHKKLDLYFTLMQKKS